MTEVAPLTDAAMLERVLFAGDLSKLSTADRLFYYQKVCESVGLNPLTRPFDYLTLNGKLTLYAKRDATDQLRKLHGVSITLTARETIEGVYVVTAKARDKSGREDEATGAVTITGLKGDALANAYMKCETKAKRRVTLSICGLGMLDETEIETIPPESRINPRGDLGKQVPMEDALEVANRMRACLESDVTEESKAMRVMDFHDELRTQHDLYVAASDQLSSKERSAWKAYVKQAQEQTRMEPRLPAGVV